MVVNDPGKGADKNEEQSEKTTGKPRGEANREEVEKCELVLSAIQGIQQDDHRSACEADAKVEQPAFGLQIDEESSEMPLNAHGVFPFPLVNYWGKNKKREEYVFSNLPKSTYAYRKSSC